ncbi:tripartite tricarboxylate transporter substrate binding protein [Alcaligenaceae bacterium]|nr:tripartite tricarboxylate transporter substrate binding protein [Alcaligenaceae bacterium]
MQRRTFLQAAGLAALATAAGASRAASYPSRPVTIWVPYAVGGNADLTARLFGDALSKQLGQTVVVGNKPGGGGAIGATHIIESRPDGYNVLLSAPSVFSVTPHLVKVSYGPSNIRPLCLVSKTPLVLVVRKGSKFKSLQEVVETARNSPSSIPMGYGGLGTPNHLAMLNLEAVGGILLNGIAYKGSGPMLQDMLAGHIELAADQISTSRPYIESGELIPIAVFGSPLDILPNVPSVSTLGAEPFDVTTYLGIAAAKDTPDTIVQAFQKAAREALADPRFISGMENMNTQVHWGTADEYQQLMSNEDEFMRKMVAAGRIQAS